MIYIRYAVPSDLDAISDLESRIFSDAWTRRSIEESLKQEYVTILTAVVKEETSEGGKLQTAEESDAAAKETIAGYLICYRMINEGNIVRVAVDPTIRRQGVGRLLMEEILKVGEEMGLTEYSLEVRVSNEPAIGLYESFGFLSEGIRKRYYTDPIEDGHIMWRR